MDLRTRYHVSVYIWSDRDLALFFFCHRYGVFNQLRNQDQSPNKYYMRSP
ncbi:uncharacterized protein DS421_19g675460 [Arachis hypogaea]|uniref:Uncharacterized protein n=1 Tax=Arachis hypogaea TaxID=3818 RepID=A0A6B9VHH2_ARAHY|nr:uncharacterized protein DS421_19g675460 [Arachis hypogaea]